MAHMVKVSAYNVGDLGSIPGSGRSPGEGNGNPLQYSCLENPMDRGAWRVIQSLESQRVRYNLESKQQQQATWVDQTHCEPGTMTGVALQ